MTIEEEFFKCFGIEPNWKDKRVKSNKTTYTAEQAEHIRRTTKNRNIQLCYPEITDRILLELICILGNGKDGNKNLNLYTDNEDEWFAVLKDKYNCAYCAGIDKNFKNALLKLCMYRADIDEFKQQVRSLFEVEK